MHKCDDLWVEYLESDMLNAARIVNTYSDGDVVVLWHAWATANEKGKPRAVKVSDRDASPQPFAKDWAYLAYEFSARCQPAGRVSVGTMDANHDVKGDGIEHHNCMRECILQNEVWSFYQNLIVRKYVVGTEQ